MAALAREEGQRVSAGDTGRVCWGQLSSGSATRDAVGEVSVWYSKDTDYQRHTHLWQQVPDMQRHVGMLALHVPNAGCMCLP
jgi:hypothetical protein